MEKPVLVGWKGVKRVNLHTLSCAYIHSRLCLFPRQCRRNSQYWWAFLFTRQGESDFIRYRIQRDMDFRKVGDKVPVIVIKVQESLDCFYVGEYRPNPIYWSLISTPLALTMFYLWWSSISIFYMLSWIKCFNSTRIKHYPHHLQFHATNSHIFKTQRKRERRRETTERERQKWRGQTSNNCIFMQNTFVQPKIKHTPEHSISDPPQGINIWFQ